jgi:nitrite reductase/ring-hydroxylating ferredoxin subunit
MEKNFNSNRREFLKKTGIVIGMGVALSGSSLLMNSCEKDESPLPSPPPTPIDLGQYPALSAAGGFAAVGLTSVKKNLLISRLDNNQFVVLDAVCTHAKCVINGTPNSSGVITCACHYVSFNVKDGSVVQHPVSGWNPVGLIWYDNSTYDSVKNQLLVDFNTKKQIPFA